ncbi:MAG TPA: universal stress protein [bacterium]|jgi:nucleotide-binding universal stress UspA family protein
MFTQIVLGVDGSEASELAVAVAADLAAQLHAAVTVVNAVADAMMIMPPVAPTEAMITPPLMTEEALQEMEQAGREVLTRTAERFQRAGVACTTRLEHGPAAAQIVEIATSVGADLIVLGSRGHGKLEELLLGSVSDTVVREATCSVLIVR